MARLYPLKRAIKAHPLMVCAMKQVCNRAKTCMHAWTHHSDHANCYSSPSTPRKLCTSYRLRSTLLDITFNTEIGKISSKLICLGWCCEWEYWQKHKTNEIHILIGEWSAPELMGNADSNILRDTLFVPKGQKLKKTSMTWGTVSSRDDIEHMTHQDRPQQDYDTSRSRIDRILGDINNSTTRR